jgi:HSP20 family protein
MAIERWDPFRDFRRFGPRASRAAAGIDSWAIPLDVVRSDDSIVVHASLPGVKPEDVTVTIEDQVLTLDGKTEAETEESGDTYLLRERRTGRYHRTIRLPDSVDPDQAQSSYEAGVLTVTIPKLEQKKAKQITVEVKGDKELSGAK